MASIEFVNHSSFVVTHGRVRLICDPWLEGSVFDSSWDLLAESRFTYDDFASITHIWFSHEHPDHFSPPNLGKIPANIRPGITVLHQNTLDKKVSSYCRKLGFGRVIEMNPDEWVSLGDGVEAHCQPHDNGDSWLALRMAGCCLVNLNDCVVNSPKECSRILERVGSVDILATQFSYANRVGNPGDQRALEAAAREKLEWVRIQAQTLKVKYVIPIASFSYFSHEDNWYLNSGINKVGTVEHFIRTQTNAEPIVLYPGDSWNINGLPYDCASAIARYDKDYDRVQRGGCRHRSREVTMDKLLEHGSAFVTKLRSKNSRLAYLLPSVAIYLEDHGQALALSLRGLRLINRRADACDLVCKSDALDYCFLWEWGGRTLDINGRFQVPERGQYRKFKLYATLASFNNRGEGLKEAVRTFQRRVFKELKLPRAKSAL